MRKFSSYGPVDKDLHFHVPRTDLVASGILRLTGEVPEKGGHFITVWAPRQCGKTWIMREAMMEIRERGQFDVAMISMQSAQTVTSDQGILELFAEKLSSWLGRPFPGISAWKDLPRLFAPPAVEKPLILIIDEFDALEEEFINKFANEFRDIYITRQTEMGQTACMLHGLALIGVRGVLGIENVKGSPFNVQRSMHIPNLTRDEVGAMFREYETESGQPVETQVVDRIHKETRGQPGLVSWFGELLTEGYDGYSPDKTRSIDSEVFDSVFQDAVDALPNNHILNIISKAKRDPYKTTVLELFKTRQAMPFRFDDPRINFLYLNGVIDREKAEGGGNLVRFASPFVQKRLFNFFSREIFPAVDHLYDPMTDIEAMVGQTDIDIPAVLRLYQTYLDRNRDWLLRDAPRRKTDLRIFEAVFHFNLYMYLTAFFQDKGGDVFPEFPTGNGKVDLLIRRREKVYALELKSFKDRYAYKQALSRAAEYGFQLEISRIFLVLFIESIDEENRRALETPYVGAEGEVTVIPFFVETGDARSAIPPLPPPPG
jgi:hypothetical protein